MAIDADKKLGSSIKKGIASEREDMSSLIRDEWNGLIIKVGGTITNRREVLPLPACLPCRYLSFSVAAEDRRITPPKFWCVPAYIRNSPPECPPNPLALRI